MKQTVLPIFPLSDLGLTGAAPYAGAIRNLGTRHV